MVLKRREGIFPSLNLGKGKCPMNPSSYTYAPVAELCRAEIWPMGVFGVGPCHRGLPPGGWRPNPGSAAGLAGPAMISPWFSLLEELERIYDGGPVPCLQSLLCPVRISRFDIMSYEQNLMHCFKKIDHGQVLGVQRPRPVVRKSLSNILNCNCVLQFLKMCTVSVHCTILSLWYIYKERCYTLNMEMFSFLTTGLGIK